MVFFQDLFRSSRRNESMTASDYRSAGESDTYTEERHFRDGSEGRTSLCRSSKTNKLIVIKQLHRHCYRKNDKGYPIEAKILLSTLGLHQNITQMFGTRLSDGIYYLATEYATGGDLLGQIKHFARLQTGSSFGDYPHPRYSDKWAERLANGPIISRPRYLVPEEFLLHVFISIASALAYIHHGLRRGRDGVYRADAGDLAVLHCDIKPDNILLSWPAGNPCGEDLPDVKLTDFGGARLASSSQGLSGTRMYLSPEAKDALDSRRITKHDRILTAKSDVYGLGHCLHEAGTYALWKIGDDPCVLQLPIAYSSKISLLEEALRKCFAVSPTQRPTAEGLLGYVEDMRKLCTELTRAHGPLPKAIWKQPLQQ